MEGEPYDLTRPIFEASLQPDPDGDWMIRVLLRFAGFAEAHQFCLSPQSAEELAAALEEALAKWYVVKHWGYAPREWSAAGDLEGDPDDD